MDLEAVADALHFAADRHRGQRRLDERGSPYVIHPLEVAGLLAASGIDDTETLVAAILHDVVEDTGTPAAEIVRRFGPGVGSVVVELTDTPGQDRAIRHRLQEERVPRLSPPARLIKLADKTCNIRDLGPDTPLHWSLDRKLDYLAHAGRIARACLDACPGLDRRFAWAEWRARAALTGGARSGAPARRARRVVPCPLAGRRARGTPDVRAFLARSRRVLLRACARDAGAPAGAGHSPAQPRRNAHLALDITDCI